MRDSDGQPLNFLTQIQDITERKLFEGRLQHLADHDSLTGLFNRRRFEEELSRELALAERHGSSAALLAIDLDNFKYINDSLGHSIGDELIARVGEALSDRLRKTDVLARLGGDEFAVILPRADEHDASRVAGALLDSVSAVDLETTGSRKRNVTASIGISIFEPGSGVTAEELHVEADIAMYDAKEAGRGRATVYSASEDRGAADAGADHLGRPDPRGARRRPLRALRPGDQVTHRRSGPALRAAAADAGRRRRGDPAGELPPRRRALRPDPGDRLLGRAARRAHPRGAPGGGP